MKDEELRSLRLYVEKNHIVVTFYGAFLKSWLKQSSDYSVTQNMNEFLNNLGGNHETN